MFLSENKLPVYDFSFVRKFVVGEHHITRYFDLSVLILMLSGELDFFENGEHIKLKRGEYYIQRPFLFQEGKYPSKVPKYFYIHFNGDYAENSGLPLRGIFNPDELMPDIEKLDKLEQSGFASEYIKNAVFYSILDKLKLNKLSVNKQMAKYLHENFTDEITIDVLAKKFGYSPNQIINIFKAEYGITPHRYINKLRLERAKQLLITTSLSIADIAYYSGFGDYTSFYRNFCNEFKISPLKWQNDNLLKNESMY